MRSDLMQWTRDREHKAAERIRQAGASVASNLRQMPSKVSQKAPELIERAKSRFQRGAEHTAHMVESTTEKAAEYGEGPSRRPGASRSIALSRSRLHSSSRAGVLLHEPGRSFRCPARLPPRSSSSRYASSPSSLPGERETLARSLVVERDARHHDAVVLSPDARVAAGEWLRISLHGELAFHEEA